MPYDSTVSLSSSAEPSAGKVPVKLDLKQGCYLLRYVPFEPPADIDYFEGTFRVLHVGKYENGKDGEEKYGAINLEGPSPKDAEIRAGGDLYRHRRSDKSKPTVLEEIPVFPRRDYKYHLEVAKVLDATENGFTARFKIHEFDHAKKWPNPGMRTIIMKRDESKPKDSPYFSGNVLDQDSGEVVGTVTMKWLTSYVRSARVVVDRVAEVESPTKSTSLEAIFAAVGWKVIVEKRIADVYPKPKTGEDKVWTVSELHNAMLQAKAKIGTKGKCRINLNDAPSPVADPKELDLVDREWCYHLMCVPRIAGFDRGVMYDTNGTDSNNIPREGAAVAAKFKFPAEEYKPTGEPRWGKAEGQLLQEVVKNDEPAYDAYLRVAVHELGHAMGLDHNHRDRGFMNTTDALAEGALEECRVAKEKADIASLNALSAADAEKNVDPDLDDIRQRAKKLRSVAVVGANKAIAEETKKQATKFPEGILMEFHPDDLERLRFGPDITVRPGTRFDDGGPLFGDNSSRKAVGLTLKVSPLLEAVPIGAPVRVRVKLINTSDKPKTVLGDLSLNSGQVWGAVTLPLNGESRTFWPLKKCGDAAKTETLAPGKSVAADLTLLRGPQAQLFPTRGKHRINVRVTWEEQESNVFVEGQTEVYITQAVDDGPHASAAATVLSTPDALLSLAIGGDHLTEGKAAIDIALKDDILRPHFAIVRIKENIVAHNNLVASKPEDAWKLLDEAWDLLDENTVLSLSEIQRIANLVDEYRSSISQVINYDAKDPNAKDLSAKRKARVAGALEVLKQTLSKLGARIGVDETFTAFKTDLDKLATEFAP